MPTHPLLKCRSHLPHCRRIIVKSREYRSRLLCAAYVPGDLQRELAVLLLDARAHEIEGVDEDRTGQVALVNSGQYAHIITPQLQYTRIYNNTAAAVHTRAYIITPQLRYTRAHI
jgi:hypothetical protein